MDRAFLSGSAGSAPTAPASPSIGYPTAGNPATATPATKPGPYWYHMITEEIRKVISDAGLTPDQTNVSQLSLAIQQMIISGGAIKAPVRTIVTTNIATLAGGAPNTNDGVSLAAGDRILLNGQTTASQNGLYVVTTLGTGANGTWTRATDADGVGELVAGMLVAVAEGTTYADSVWELATDGVITIGTTAITFTRKDNPAINSGGIKNRIINGLMAVDQRNSGAAQTFTAATALAYSVDRFYGYCTGANITGQQVAGPIANTYRYQFTGAASNTGLGFGTRLEAINTADLAGQTATLQVKAKSSSLTTLTWTAYYANTKDTFGTLASPTRTQIATGSFTINAAEATYSANISVPAAATTGIEIVFTGGALLAGQTLTLGDVQLEQGASASLIERRPYGIELTMAQRYYEKQTAYLQYDARAAAAIYGFILNMKASKRVAPTLGITAGTRTNVSSISPSVIGTEFASVALTAAATGNTSAVNEIYTMDSEL